MEIINVWVDGSCINNGTPNAKAGMGIYYGKDDERNYASRLTVSRQTNNTAELIAILYVLCTNTQNSLYIYTDSEYSIKCITVYSAKWKINGWKTAKGTEVESADIIRTAVEMISNRSNAGMETVFVHVKGHSGDRNNDAADKLARVGSDTEKEGGRIHILRKCGMPV